MLFSIYHNSSNLFFGTLCFSSPFVSSVLFFLFCVSNFFSPAFGTLLNGVGRVMGLPARERPVIITSLSIILFFFYKQYCDVYGCIGISWFIYYPLLWYRRLAMLLLYQILRITEQQTSSFITPCVDVKLFVVEWGF